MRSTAQRPGEDLHTAPALIRDLFWSFHKRAPRINENLALKPAFVVNRRILEEIMSTAEWRQLREAGSINDPMISSIATIGACERAAAKLEESLGSDDDERNRAIRQAARWGWLKPWMRPMPFRTRSRLSAEVIPRVTEEAERRVR